MAKKKRQYSRKASEEVGEALHKLKRGEQRSGTKGKAKSRKQAIAIGLAKARKEGAKVPSQGKSTSTKKKANSKKKVNSTKKVATKRSKTRSKKTTAKKRR